MKVDRDVRDRFAAVARAQEMTVAGLLREVSLRLETEQRWRDIYRSYRRLRVDDHEAWLQYLGELGEWDATSGDELGDAADEWPEYNG